MPSPKNIYIVGASSTGKTTLINALAEHFSSSANGPSFLISNCPSPLHAENSSGDPTFSQCNTLCRPQIIHEFARPILAHLRITRQDLGTSSDITLKAQRAILSAQCAAERTITTTTLTAAEHPHTDNESGEWFISDRSALDGMVYTELFVSAAEAEKLMASEEWAECRGRKREGLVFLCESGGRWLVDDVVRSMPASVEDWRAFDGGFGRMAREEGIEVRVVLKEMLGRGKRVGFIGEVMGWGGK